MTIARVPITSISPDPANARKHPKRNVDAIVASLRRFGQQRPIVVDAKNVVRAGNGTLQAAKQLGWTEIDIVRSDLPPSELTAFAIADNRTAELAAWDDDVLANLLVEPGIGDVGFDDGDMADMFPSTVDSDSSTRDLTKNNKLPLVKITVAVDNVASIESAIRKTGNRNRGQALTQICEAYCNASGQLDLAI